MIDDQDTTVRDNPSREAGLRVTRHGQMIVHILIEADFHPGAEQVLSHGCEHDASICHVATCRRLAALSAQGLVRSHASGSGAASPCHDDCLVPEPVARAESARAVWQH